MSIQITHTPKVSAASRAAIRICIVVGGTKIEGVAIDGAGLELARRRVATPRGDYEATLASIAALIGGIERDVGPAERVGVGTPGSASRITGVMKNCNSTWLNGRPLR